MDAENERSNGIEDMIYVEESVIEDG